MVTNSDYCRFINRIKIYIDNITIVIVHFMRFDLERDDTAKIGQWIPVQLRLKLISFLKMLHNFDIFTIKTNAMVAVTSLRIGSLTILYSLTINFETFNIHSMLICVSGTSIVKLWNMQIHVTIGMVQRIQRTTFCQEYNLYL